MGLLGIFAVAAVDAADATRKPTPPGWKVESVCRDNYGKVIVTLFPPPELLSEAAAPLRAAGAEAADALRQSEAGQALLRQRQLLLDTRAGLTAGQAAVGQARADRLATLSRGEDPGQAEAALRQALVDVDLCQERLGLLSEAIAKRENEVDEAWNQSTTALLQKWGQEARQRLEKATAALAAAMPAALTEAVSAMQLGLAVTQSWTAPGEFVPHRPLGSTPRPPVLLPEPNPLAPYAETLTRAEIHPLPPCPQCSGQLALSINGMTKEIVVQCESCAAVLPHDQIPDSHPLHKVLVPA